MESRNFFVGERILSFDFVVCRFDRLDRLDRFEADRCCRLCNLVLIIFLLFCFICHFIVGFLSLDQFTDRGSAFCRSSHRGRSDIAVELVDGCNIGITVLTDILVTSLLLPFGLVGLVSEDRVDCRLNLGDTFSECFFSGEITLISSDLVVLQFEADLLCFDYFDLFMFGLCSGVQRTGNRSEDLFFFNRFFLFNDRFGFRSDRSNR